MTEQHENEKGEDDLLASSALSSIRARLANLGLSNKGHAKDLRKRLNTHERETKKMEKEIAEPCIKECAIGGKEKDEESNLSESTAVQGDTENGTRSDLENDTRAEKVPHFDYYLCLDVESTCEENGGFEFPNEVIEWPVVMVDARTFKTTDIFHSYVQPTVNKNLSAFCTRLTGISQETVNESPSFPVTLDAFELWLRRHKLYLPAEDPNDLYNDPSASKSAVFVTDGAWDLRDHVRKTIDVNPSIPSNIPYLAGPFIDVRRFFVSHFSHKEGVKTLNGMLQDLGLEFEGREHSGVDDAKNVARMLERIVWTHENSEEGAESRKKLAVKANRWLDHTLDRKMCKMYGMSTGGYPLAKRRRKKKR